MVLQGHILCCSVELLNSTGLHNSNLEQQKKKSMNVIIEIKYTSMKLCSLYTNSQTKYALKGGSLHIYLRIIFSEFFLSTISWKKMCCTQLIILWSNTHPLVVEIGVVMSSK